MNRIGTVFVFLAAALAAGCGSGDTRLSVLLKDAPTTSLSEAWVTITDINLVGSNGITRLGPSQPSTVDLLTLANQTAKLVDEMVVPPGKYTELRIVLAGGCVRYGGTYYAASPNAHMANGACMSATGALRMPSMGQSGLKVTMSGDALNVAEGSKGVLLIDFDAAQSFGLEAGSSGAWVMHPVITGGDLALSGNVVATVGLATGYSPSTTVTPYNCTVSLTPVPTTTDPQPTPVTATITAGLGSAQLYPPPGSYTTALACAKLTAPTPTPLTVTATATLTGTLTPADTVTVSAGQASPITFTITALQ